jgi:outer membrane protein, multidrug efflux system
LPPEVPAGLPPTLLVPAGVPSTLLERRPDLRQAEQQLISANANVGAAIASFFPRISLTGALGGVSTEVSELFQAGKTWSIAAGLTGPLFQGLRLKNQYDVNVAQWEQAKIQYESAVTNAFGEVSTALVAHQKLEEVERRQARSVAAYQEAVRIATIRYVAGLSSYVEVLDSQQQLFPAENALAQARFSRLSNFVQLYKALGGGWNTGDPSWVRLPLDSSAPKTPTAPHL